MPQREFYCVINAKGEHIDRDVNKDVLTRAHSSGDKCGPLPGAWHFGRISTTPGSSCDEVGAMLLRALVHFGNAPLAFRGSDGEVAKWLWFRQVPWSTNGLQCL